MSVSITTNNVGEYYPKLITKATVGNEVVEQGLINMVEPKLGKNKYFIPRLSIVGNVLQKRTETPDAVTHDKGAITVDEKVLEGEDMMVFTTFNPNEFESLWLPFQPEGFVLAELPDEVQQAILDRLIKKASSEIGNHLLMGEKGAGAEQFFNGLITRARNNVGVVKVSNPAALTKDNILEVLKTVKAGLPTEVRNNPNLKMLCSWEAYDLYDQAVTAAKQAQTITDESIRKYKGIPLVPLAYMPDNTILCTYMSLTDDSNTWGVITYSDANEPILTGRISNTSERYFFKMLMKADTQIAWDEHVVLYDYTGV